MQKPDSTTQILKEYRDHMKVLKLPNILDFILTHRCAGIQKINNIEDLYLYTFLHLLGILISHACTPLIFFKPCTGTRRNSKKVQENISSRLSKRKCLKSPIL